MTQRDPETRTLWAGLIGDGRPALATVGVGLAFAGGLAIYLGLTRQLLPHDLSYLNMTAEAIDGVADGRLMDFMVHDRVSWGGSLVAVGVMYLWLTAFPLGVGRRWAWVTFCVTGLLGFASFASHLPTGYLDSWHGTGTLLLLPVFALGLEPSEPDRHRGTRGSRRWGAAGWSSSPPVWDWPSRDW